MIEQLHYTWSLEGLEGVGQFQVADATPALRPVSGALYRFARPLFRPPSEQTSDAFAFGWVHTPKCTLVFYRFWSGSDGHGRPGNFAVHVLAMPPRGMSISQILSPAVDGLWWDGSPSSAELKVLDRQGLLPPDFAGPTMETDGAQRALAQMVAQGFEGTIVGSPSDVLSAVGGVAAVMPSVLDELKGFSCHEPTDMRAWFSLAGEGGAIDRASDIAPPWQEAAKLVARGAQGDGLEARKLFLDCTTRGQTDWPKFAQIAAALEGLNSGTEAGIESILPALSAPESSRRVLTAPLGQSRVLDALTANPVTHLAEIRRAIGMADRGLAFTLGQKLALMQQEAGLALNPGWQNVRQFSADFRAGFAAAVAEAQPFLSSPPQDLVIEMSRATALSPAASEAIARELAPWVGDRLSDSSIPVDLRARSVVVAFDLSLTTRAGLLTAVAEDEVLAAAVLAAMPAHRFSEIADRLPPSLMAEILVALAWELDRNVLLDQCLRLLPAIDASHRLKVCGSLVDVVDPTDTRWQAALDAVFVDRMRAILSDTTLPIEPDRLTRVCSLSPTGRSWKAILAQVPPRGAPLQPSARGRLLSSLLRMPEPDMPLAASFVIQVLTWGFQAKSDVEVVERHFGHYGVDPVSSQMVLGVERALLCYGRIGPGIALLIGFLMRPALSERIEDRLRALVSRVSEDQWELVRTQIADRPELLKKADRLRRPKTRFRRMH